MPTIRIHDDLDLPGRGLSVLGVQPDELTLGGMPFLAAWLDPNRFGDVTFPTMREKKNGDLWQVNGIAPALIASHAPFNGRPALDFTAGGTVGLKASNRQVTVSWTIFMVINFTTSVPSSGARNVLRYFQTGTTLGGVLRVRNRGLGMTPDWPGGGSTDALTWLTAPMSPGVHIIGAAWDNLTSTATLYADVPEPVANSALALSSTVTATSRWILGNGSALEAYVGDMLIFENHIERAPGGAKQAINYLRARIGLAAL